jgi:hypothetical protein
MDLATIEMPVEAAQERLDAYAKQVAKERTAEDRKIIKGYEAMVKGHSIIELSQSIQAGGFFDSGLPKIAVARATGKTCWVKTSGWEEAITYSSEEPDRWGNMANRGALVNDVTVRIRDQKIRRSNSGRTIMPMVPPEVRAEVGPDKLHRYHILWEVEEWTMIAPRDPALLYWIAGDLWEVIALWDLTDLERAVLAR